MKLIKYMQIHFYIFSCYSNVFLFFSPLEKVFNYNISNVELYVVLVVFLFSIIYILCYLMIRRKVYVLRDELFVAVVESKL